MRPSSWSRAAGVLLAVVFLASVGGASDLDALLFHSGAGAGAVTGSHFERPGASHHADHCLLALRIGAGRRPVFRAIAIRLQAAVLESDAPRPAPAPHRFYPGLHQDLRAPPFSRV